MFGNRSPAFAKMFIEDCKAKAKASSGEGFSFIELIVVIAIIGILLAVAIPNFRSRQPGFQRKQFINHLNALTQVAWQDAVISGKVHRMLFDLGKNTVSVEIATNKKSAEGQEIFDPMPTSSYINSTYNWPETFEFKNFYVNNRDELNLTLSSKSKGKIWFYIVPQGLAQSVIINMIDKKDSREFSLMLNPFLVQFKEYDAFQKP